MTNQSLSELRKTIQSYPYPIIAIINKYLRIPTDKFQDRHAILCDIYESLVKFVAIVLLNESVITDKKIKEHFPGGLEFLKHPSLGHWVSVIRELCSDNISDESKWTTKISKWWQNDKPQKELLSNYDHLQEITFPKGSKTTAGIIDSLVTYRNKVWKGHGAAVLPVESLKQRIPALENLLSYLLESANYLNEMNVFYTQEVKKKTSTQFEADSISFTGVELSSIIFIYDEFEPNEIYLTGENQTELNSKPLLLSPLMEWKNNNNGDPQIYFFNDARRTKLEYLSYIDGSFYYHKEIKRELEKLFSVNLEKSSEDFENIIHNYSEDQRKERSETFHLRGLELVNEGKFDSAIVSFEDALEWYRTPQTIVEICKAMLKLGDDKEYALANLEYAFEIEPEYVPAIVLRKKLESSDMNVDTVKDNSDIDYSSIKRQNYTYYDLVFTNKFREFALPIWLTFIIIVYFISAFLLFFLEPQNRLNNIFSTFLLLIQSLIPVVGIYAGKHNYQDAYFGLLGQLNNMRIERFNEWFRNNYARMFGHFKVTTFDKESLLVKNKYNSKWDLRIKFREERIFIYFSFFFILIWSFNAIPLQKLYEHSFIVASIRFFDTFLLWVILTPVIRYIFTSTMFIKEYSNLDLNPVISSLGNNGYQRLTKIFILNLILIILFYLADISWNLIIAKDPFYTDFIGVAFEIILFLFWAILTPMFISRAIKLSKASSTYTYQDHLKQAFKNFIKNPDNSTIEKLDWLKEQEKKLIKISTKSFSLSQLILLIMSIVLLILSTLFYAVIRLDITNELYIKVYNLLF